MSQKTETRNTEDQQTARMILKCLKLGLAATTSELAQDAAGVACHIWAASTLTLAEFDDLKAVAAAGMTSKDSSEVQSRSMLKRHAVQS